MGKIKLVAKINGVSVHSDMEIRGIKNGRVEFADGSFCDVETGKIHLVGDGTIKMSGRLTEPLNEGMTISDVRVGGSIIQTSSTKSSVADGPNAHMIIVLLALISIGAILLFIFSPAR